MGQWGQECTHWRRRARLLRLCVLLRRRVGAACRWGKLCRRHPRRVHNKSSNVNNNAVHNICNKNAVHNVNKNAVQNINRNAVLAEKGVGTVTQVVVYLDSRGDRALRALAQPGMQPACMRCRCVSTEIMCSHSVVVRRV